MKKFLLAFMVVLLAVPAFGATCTERVGEN